MGTTFARRAATVAAAGLLLFAALIGWTASARADTVSQIAQGLRGARLYVTTDAGSVLPASAQAQVRGALDAANEANIRVVVTRSGVDQQSLVEMLRAVKDRVGKGDTYVAVTADNKMLAISDRLSGKELNQIITQTGGAGIQQRLVEFSTLAEDETAEKARAGAFTTVVLLSLLIVAVAGITGIFLVSRSRRRRRKAQEMADLKQGVQEDVTRLGEDVAALDLDLAKAEPDVREDYERALNSYDSAKAATEAAQRPEDMRNVTSALEDGRYHMAAVRARLAGEPVPERRAPCFFNPQHGPSVRDVTWAPLGGTPRDVPACAADAEALESGVSPDTRMVPVGGIRRPYWEAGPAYAPYAGGYYGAFGGMDLLSGMLIGTALGSMLGGGWGYPVGHGGPGDDFGGDVGDVGGGWDFGSGDFGGGGFGGDF